MQAIASVCKPARRRAASNVLAAIKKTNIAATANRSGSRSRSPRTATWSATSGYLFKIRATGKYVEIPTK